MTEWRQVSLGDVCELKRGYDLPRGSRVAGAVPVISSSGPTGFHTEAKVRAPGVVTGRYGTLGDVFYITEDFWPLNTALYVRDFKGNDPRYVAALLQSMNLAQYDGAAAVPGLNRNQLHTVPVRIPGLDTQRSIASILTTLDDLIENNRRRVQVLEEIVRTTYREWFVLFRFPGCADATFVNSAAGPIPDTWRAGYVGELVELVKRTVDPKDVDPTTPAVGLEHIPRRKITLDNWGVSTEIASRKAAFESGDLLFGKIRPYFHKVSVAPIAGICSTDALVLRPLVEHWGQAVLTIASDDYVAYATQTSNGTKMPRADWKVISQFKVAIPPIELSKHFTEIVREQLEMAERLMLQNRSLAAMRDLLLPKLVTGRIDVSDLDLDKLIEGAVA